MTDLRTKILAALQAPASGAAPPDLAGFAGRARTQPLPGPCGTRVLRANVPDPKRRILTPLPSAPPAPPGLVLPPGYEAAEGYATDYDPWTYQSFRAVLRYGEQWMPLDRTIREIAFRPDSTYAYALVDRLGGRVRIWCSAWDGQHGFGWPDKGALLYDSQYDPPAYAIAQSWTPQPFSIRFSLSGGFVVPHSMGLQVEIQLDGVPDPIWGNRATYWLDVAGDAGGTVSDQWLDTEPPYMGCGGFPSETRTWMVPNRLSLWAQQAALPNAPAVVMISPTPILSPDCLDVDLANAILVPTTTDAGGEVMVTVPFPLTPVEFAWQTLIWDSAKSDPLQMLGSGHFVRFNPSVIPSGILWDHDVASGAPRYSIPGSVWVTEIR